MGAFSWLVDVREPGPLWGRRPCAGPGLCQKVMEDKAASSALMVSASVLPSGLTSVPVNYKLYEGYTLSFLVAFGHGVYHSNRTQTRMPYLDCAFISQIQSHIAH